MLERRSFFEPCTICLNLHGRTKSVVTSCLHTFHESCLNATKGLSNPPTCPLCRSVYTETVSKRGYYAARNYAASKIQAVIRSFLTRQKLMNDPNFKLPKHIRILRSEFVSKTIQNYSRTAISNAQLSSKESDELILASEIALTAARRIFAKVSIGPIVIAKEFERAVQRTKEISDCPVCISSLGTKSVSFLSCSHIIHETCRIQLEKFCPELKCPICRQHYTFINSTIDSLPHHKIIQ